MKKNILGLTFIILTLVGVSFTLTGCGDEREEALNQLASEEEVRQEEERQEEAVENSPYEISDGQGTDNYDLWWNPTKDEDGNITILFNGEDNSIGLAIAFPDKLPSETNLQILGMIYKDTIQGIEGYEDRTFARLVASYDEYSEILLDITGHESEIPLKEGCLVNILTQRDKIGVIKWNNGEDEEDLELHDYLVVTGNVVVEDIE